LHIGLGLGGLEVGADVVADVDVGDVDREDLEGGAGIRPLVQDILEMDRGSHDELVRVGHADRGDDALADRAMIVSSVGPADEPVQIRTAPSRGLHP
jgi:hypothetical protein